MKNCVIIGRTNSGKTLFLLNFSDFLGVKGMEIIRQTPEGGCKAVKMGIDEAKRQMVGPGMHMTRSSYGVTVGVSKGKGRTSVVLVDTPGLMEGIHPDREVRSGAVEAIRRLKDADIVLHVIDVSRQGAQGPPMADVDCQIATYSSARRSYVILANKMDLPGASSGLASIKRTFPGKIIVPVSALKRWGFREVKTLVAHFA